MCSILNIYYCACCTQLVCLIFLIQGAQSQILYSCYLNKILLLQEQQHQKRILSIYYILKHLENICWKSKTIPWDDFMAQMGSEQQNLHWSQSSLSLLKEEYSRAYTAKTLYWKCNMNINDFESVENFSKN